MSRSRHLSHAIRRILFAGSLLLLLQGCQTAPERTLDPDTIRASSIRSSDQVAVLERWRLALAFANEFLASSFNRTLPREARLRLDPGGMQFVTSEREMPIKLLLVDDYRTSSCVCATVDTYKDVVYVHRPWGVDVDLPIEAHNTFFAVEHGTQSADVNLATHVLRMASILYYEKHAHISTWEWFKCQWLEWLIGSGHHEYSMQRPDAVSREVFYFWHGVDPLPPSGRRILAREAGAATSLDELLANRSRAAVAWRERFEQYLRERDATTVGDLQDAAVPK